MKSLKKAKKMYKAMELEWISFSLKSSISLKYLGEV